jgi:cob(I)alamin adenosyltransferase
MKIYTRTGDKGETSLFGGKRVPKNSLRVDTYGIVDELNSAVGVVLAHVSPEEKKLRDLLVSIQHDLLLIGSSLANPVQKPLPYLQKREKVFERHIDQMTEKLPELRNFILPGGGKAGAFLHLARTICRRAERRVVQLSREEPIEEGILRYFNRLSDLLFTMARFINFTENQTETKWVKPV